MKRGIIQQNESFTKSPCAAAIRRSGLQTQPSNLPLSLSAFDVVGDRYTEQTIWFCSAALISASDGIDRAIATPTQPRGLAHEC
jgi:hypothetical protein